MSALRTSAASSPASSAMRSACATAAIILTIIGCAVALYAIVAADRLDNYLRYRSPEGLLMLDLAILLAGLICGVLAKREPAGKVCAWISGVVFVFLLLLVAA